MTNTHRNFLKTNAAVTLGRLALSTAAEVSFFLTTMPNTMPKKILLTVLLFAVALPGTHVFGQNNMYPKITVNEWFQGNLKYVEKINDFDGDETLDGWQHGTGVRSIAKIGGQPMKGSGCLEITLGTKTPALAEITRNFPQPLNMTAAPVLAFGVSSHPRTNPGVECYAVSKRQCSSVVKLRQMGSGDPAECSAGFLH